MTRFDGPYGDYPAGAGGKPSRQRSRFERDPLGVSIVLEASLELQGW
jgi:hypothetical protein